MSILVGVLAEDLSDVDVIEEVVAKKRSRRLFKIKKFVGHGCGKLRAKCHDWARNLSIQRCTLLILIHDLHENDLHELRGELEDALRPSPMASHVIVIPIREIEAWLLADHDAINQTFGLRLKKISNPEAIRRPKEHLRDLVYLRSNKTKIYVNTIHNKRIAAKASLKQLKRCGSFVPLDEFLHRSL